MVKTFKWLYRLGYTHTKNETLRKIEGMQQFHAQQAQIAHFRAKDECDKPKMSAVEHEVASKVLLDVLNSLDPERYPNIDDFLEKML